MFSSIDIFEGNHEWQDTTALTEAYENGTDDEEGEVVGWPDMC